MAKADSVTQSHAARAITNEMVDLLDRTGDECGIFLKPLMYAVRMNDAESEAEIPPDEELEAYRFYICEGIPIDNRKNGPTMGMMFDEVKWKFLEELEKIAKAHALNLIFPEEPASVCCNDLSQLRQAIDIMKRQNRIVSEPEPEVPIDETKLRDFATAIAEGLMGKQISRP